ncbi:MAG: GFA family protein [Candidatus Lambdaproteobacteria bacterium]|nr:GFA family protein [Candidatus Lambdaproteobacteria bacterium]
MHTYHGSCHCGRVRFEAELELTYVSECNCSICRKKGILHHRVPPERFRLLGGQEVLRTYRFNTGTAQHHFCSVCGIHTHTNPRADPSQFTINVRCLDDVDLDALTLERRTFDGRNWEQAVKEWRERK